MGLTAELSAKLDAGSLGTSLTGSLSAQLVQLHRVNLSIDQGQVGQITSGAGQVNLAAVTSAISQAASRVTSLVASLPHGSDIIAPIESALQVVEAVGAQSLADRFQQFTHGVGAALDQAPGNGLLAALIKLVELLSGSSEGDQILDLLQKLTGSQIQIPTQLPLGDGLRAGDNSLRILGGMMALESVLSEAERLTQTMSETIDVARLRADLDAVGSLLQADGGDFTAFVRGIQGDDLATINTVIRRVQDILARLGSLREQMAAGMGMGEATLVYLDIDKLLLELAAAAAILRTADMDPIHRTAANLAEKIQPLLVPDLMGAPARDLNALLAQLETRIAGFASQLGALDLSQFVRPLTDGIHTITSTIATAADAIASVVRAFQAAMARVRDAVAALPIGDIAAAIRHFLEPVTRVIQTIRDVVNRIEQALKTASATVGGALDSVDTLLSNFKTQIDQLFAGAKQVVETVNIGQVSGAIAANVQSFAGLLAKAQMKPYFDTAVSAIGTAANVIGAVPFGLLPDSMKADVDAAVAPIKNTNTDSVKAEIEGLLQIAPGGHFELRVDIEHAVADIQAKYDELIKAVKDHDPRIALAAVETKLQELAQRVRELQPSLTLEPIQKAVDQVKQVIAGINLDSVLQPVRDAFKIVLDSIDQYSPARLVAPLQQRLDQARQNLINTIKLDAWTPAIDDVEHRIMSALDFVNPTRIQPLIQQAVDELTRILTAFPVPRIGGSFGGVLAALLNGAGQRANASSFDEVLGWLRGASGAATLNARAGRISEYLVHTRDAVTTFDVRALSVAITHPATDLVHALESLASRVAADNAQADTVLSLSVRLRAEIDLGALIANRDRYLSELQTAASAAENLKRTGFSEVDVAAAGFRAALGPLKPARDFVAGVFSGLGLAGTGGVPVVIRRLLQIFTPARITSVIMPLFTALHDRVKALLDAVLVPVKQAITQIKTLIGEIDLKPLTDAVTSVFNELKQQIQRLSPDNLLKEPLDAFKALQHDLATNDPVKTVITILNTMRDKIASILEKLNFQKLLATPLAIYDHIVVELSELNVTGLLNPVLDQLDQIAAQVDTGLTDTVTAFKHLQEALPGGGGSASVSVGVGIG